MHDTEKAENDKAMDIENILSSSDYTIVKGTKIKPGSICYHNDIKCGIKSSIEIEDLVNHPPHYTDHPSGIECIQITEHMGFCLGNAVKYIWRAGLKKDKLEDLKKAVWYINREIERCQKG